VTESIIPYESASIADIALASLPSELGLVLETAERMLKKSDSVRRFRSQRGDPAKAREQSAWQTFAAMGLSGVSIPTDLGGAGLDLRAAALVAEIVGRNLAPEPIIACSVFPAAFLTSLACAEGNKLLKKLADGKAMPVIADCRSEGAVLSMASGSLRLQSTATYVHGSAWATDYIVLAKRDKVTCAVLVPASATNLVSHPEELADGSFRARLRFEDIELDRSSLIAEGEACDEKFSAAVDWANVVISAELFGIQSALFDTTIAYLKTRRQFDRLLGSFQALQHRAADLYCGKEIARFVVAEAIDNMFGTEDPIVRSRIASQCKARAAASALAIGREAVQMHGAMGFSDECDVGLFLKRAVVLAAWLGGVEFHRRRIAQSRLLTAV
jgi:3-oxochol-4-en-24-oyl-CoA dehydrogenase